MLNKIFNLLTCIAGIVFVISIGAELFANNQINTVAVDTCCLWVFLIWFIKEGIKIFYSIISEE